MKVTAKMKIVHGSHNLKRGESADLPEAVARDLLAAGIVSALEEKKAPEPSNKADKKPKNKGE